jgi:hypothetical protein
MKSNLRVFVVATTLYGGVSSSDNNDQIRPRRTFS